MKSIIIFGGSGFIGQNLSKELSADYEVIIVSRRKKQYKNLKSIRLRRSDYKYLLPYFEEAEGVINLAGENVGSRWDDIKKTAIRESRLDVDATIVQTFKACANKPKFLLQGSSMGVYGYSRTTKVISEKSQLGRHGFLTKVSTEHEQMFRQLEKLTRVVYLRTGLVLGQDGGALPKLTRVFNSFLGGTLGNGKQWNSWIHINDEVRAIRYLAEMEDAKGPFNLTAPNPVNQKEMAKTLGKVLKKPSFLRTPAFILRLFLGEMADEMLLSGLNIVPARLLDHGFQFEFEQLEDALIDLSKK